MRGREAFTRTTLRMSAGVIIWAVHFAVIYGYTGLACAERLGTSGLGIALIPWVVGAATLVAVALIIPRVLPVFRTGPRPDFVTWMSAYVALLALAAILLEALPPLWLPLCT